MTTLPSLKQLQYLVALAKHLNFTRAAESCFVTQSTLSAGLRELEDLLGARLVERDRQSVLMTPLGEEITQRARLLLAEAQDIVSRAAESAAPMQGLVRLGIIPTIAPFILPDLLARLRIQHPSLQLALREDRTADLLQRLEDGQLDFALIALPYDTGRLRVEPLFDDPLWLVGKADDPTLRPERITPTTNLNKHLLLLEEGHCLRNHALLACDHNMPDTAGKIEATSLLTLVQMIESGLGVGLIPEMAIRSGLARSPSLASRPLAAGTSGRTIALVARQTTSRLVELTALSEILLSTHAELH